LRWTRWTTLLAGPLGPDRLVMAQGLDLTALEH